MDRSRLAHNVWMGGVLLAMLAACGPTRKESWNSYYYGTERRSSAGIYSINPRAYPMDNDDHYVMPRGAWDDDQTPQHPRWNQIR